MAFVPGAIVVGVVGLAVALGAAAVQYVRSGHQSLIRQMTTYASDMEQRIAQSTDDSNLQIAAQQIQRRATDLDAAGLGGRRRSLQIMILRRRLTLGPRVTATQKQFGSGMTTCPASLTAFENAHKAMQGAWWWSRSSAQATFEQQTARLKELFSSSDTADSDYRAAIGRLQHLRNVETEANSTLQIEDVLIFVLTAYVTGVLNSSADAGEPIISF